MKCEKDDLFPLGSLAIVTRGKCAGRICAVVGKSGKLTCGSALLIADGKAISARNPKRKNPKHLKDPANRVVSEEIAQRLAQGKTLDDGWLIEAIRRRMR